MWGRNRPPVDGPRQGRGRCLPACIAIAVAGVTAEAGLVAVTHAPPVQTLVAVADARVNEANPSSNAGSASELRVRAQSGGSYESYLRFDVPDSGGSVVSATLRLFCTDASPAGGLVFPTSSEWSEDGLTWNDRPPATGPEVASLGSVVVDAWVEVDVTAAVRGAGPVSFLLVGTSSNSALYSSREGSQPPELVIEFGATGPTDPPDADFAASTTTGAAPLAVTFTDASSGPPTSWAWDFGDGASSSERDPAHVYARPGAYTVTLTATNALGSSTLTREALVVVAPAPPVQTLVAVADARVNEANPSSNAGSASELRVRAESGGSYESYLRFDVPDSGGSVVSATLRLFCTDASPAGGLVFPTSSEWSERGLTWNDRPPATGPEIASLGSVVVGAWAEVDVTAAVRGAGPVSFLLVGTSSNSALYSSREGAQPPELVIETSSAPPGPPVAAFSASPKGGFAPLTVAFADLSSGGVTAWTWDFGDGTSSTASDPSHVYARAGSYSVSLTVSGPDGSDVETKSDLVVVAPAPPVRTLVAVADARVSQANPSSSAGSASELRVRAESGGSYESYVRFDVPDLGAPVTSATLRLFCTDASPVGGLVFPTSSAWSEGTLSWSNRPSASGPEIGSLGSVVEGEWVEVDVTGAIDAEGPISFLLRSTSSNSALYSSREGAHPPELVLATRAAGTGGSQAGPPEPAPRVLDGAEGER